MVDQKDSDMKLALKLPQIPEQGRDLRGLVFIALMQADERIQDQEHRSERFHGQAQTLAIQSQVQTQSRSGDDVQGQFD
jgi:hypothetical protein